MSEEEANVVVAIDDDGNEVELEVVAELDVDGKLYAVLVPRCEEGCETDDDDEQDCIVCRVEGEDDDQNLVEIEDDDEYDRVMEAFDEMYADGVFGEDEEDEEDGDEDGADEPAEDKGTEDKGADKK